MIDALVGDESYFVWKKYLLLRKIKTQSRSQLS